MKQLYLFISVLVACVLNIATVTFFFNTIRHNNKAKIQYHQAPQPIQVQDPLNYVRAPQPIQGNQLHVFDPTRYETYVPYNSRSIEAQLRDGEAKDGQQPYFQSCIVNNINSTWKQNPYLMTVDLLNWMLLEPVVTINQSCIPPPLPDPTKMDCQKSFPRAGFSTVRSNPRKLAVAFNYGFEVDVLEIYLAEVYDVVDKIFICEAVKAHKGSSPKLLMWEHLKHQPRFRKYQDKVVHLILDDEKSIHSDKQLFGNEFNQERVRFTKFKEWNQKTHFFNDDDLVGFGDADEIPLRSTLQYLKYCDLKNLRNPIDIGSWLLEQKLSQSFKTDFPVDKINHSYGDPTFHSIQSVDKNTYLTRNRGRSKHFMIGGMHYSSQFYAPFMLMKMTHCTECHGFPVTPQMDYKSWLRNATKYTATKNREKYCIDKRGKLGELEQYPWLLMCNPERFKSVYGFLDDRLFLTKEQVPFRCTSDQH